MALCEYVPATLGNSDVEFHFLGFLWHCFSWTTRGVAGLCLAKAHLKKSEEICTIESRSLHHPHRFSLMMVNTS